MRAFNIRGTSGAGKSTLMRGLIDQFGLAPVMRTDGKKIAHYLGHGPGNRPFAVLGDYTNPTGGCDGIKTQGEVCDRVRELTLTHEVFFEGLLISGLHSRYSALDDDLRARGDAVVVFAFLDTPINLCLERVAERRSARGNTSELDPANTVAKNKSVKTAIRKFREEGRHVHILRHGVAMEDLIGLFEVYT